MTAKSTNSQLLHFFIFCYITDNFVFIADNSLDPDQTVPKLAVCSVREVRSESTLFCSFVFKKENNKALHMIELD